jgi:hypothetical protein
MMDTNPHTPKPTTLTTLKPSKRKIKPPTPLRKIHTTAKHREPTAQQHKQLNIYQCKAWNPWPTAHALNTPTMDDTPGPTHTDTTQTTHNPPLVDATHLPHSDGNTHQIELNLDSHIHTTPPLVNTNYTHQGLKVLTLNTRGMHTTIIDLQKILTNHSDPHIIALTETKHRNIKSIWRQTLKNYKLIYNPSLYNKLTNAARAAPYSQSTQTPTKPSSPSAFHSNTNHTSPSPSSPLKPAPPSWQLRPTSHNTNPTPKHTETPSNGCKLSSHQNINTHQSYWVAIYKPPHPPNTTPTTTL